MSFIGLQAFKVKLFSEKSLASKSNSQESPFLHFFFFSTYNRKVVTVLTKSISLVLGLQMIKNHLKEQATVLICIFAQPIWISLFFFFSLSWKLLFLLVTLQEEFPPVKYHLCWICTSNKNKTLKTIHFCFSAVPYNLLWSKFWNHFQAEITP